MRTLVVSLLLGLLLCGHTSNLLAQTEYTVALTVEDHWWESMENWGVWLKAVVSHDGIPLPNSERYYYEWWAWFSHEANWRVLSAVTAEARNAGKQRDSVAYRNNAVSRMNMSGRRNYSPLFPTSTLAFFTCPMYIARSQRQLQSCLQLSKLFVL